MQCSVVAVIGVIGVVLGAIITGIFALEKQPSPTPIPPNAPTVITSATPTASVINYAKLHVGDTAPVFILADTHGNILKLSEEIQNHRSVVLIFYRGYW